jgi:hypothetical protein
MTNAYNLHYTLIYIWAIIKRMLNKGQPTGAQRREVDVDSPKKVLVGIRVTPNFHRRIQTECVRRDLSLQNLVVEALKEFFETPIDEGELIEIGTLEPLRSAEEEAWHDLWAKYVRAMPREKIQVMTGAMEWDITMRKSSRRRQSVQGSKTRKSGGKQ